MLSMTVALCILLAARLCGAADAPKYDMAPFKAIAEETLKLLKSKDYAGAEKKILDLEEKWDDGTKLLKTADRKVWTGIDKQMDVAIDATKAAKDAAGAEKAIKEIDAFIAKLTDAEKVK